MKEFNHFVPQFYLKNFSTNKKGIGMFLLDKRKFIANASIKEVGGRDYLYGEDGKIEDWFMQLEGIWSKIIKNIILNEEIPNDIEEYTNLLIFIYLSEARTAQVADYQTSLLNKLSEFIFKNDKKFKDMNLKDIPKVKYNIPNLISLQIMPNIVCTCMQDLVLFIIKNNSSLDFITSDYPVTKYNLLFKKRNYMRGYGYAQMGFQAFLPISNKLCLCLMDPIPYNIIKCNEKRIIHLNNENLVYELNKLFLDNSDEMIFFSNNYNEGEIQRLTKNKQKVEKMEAYKLGNDREWVIPFQTKGSHIEIKMPYFKVRKEFMKIPLPIHAAGPIRPTAEKLIEEYKEMDKNKNK